jgi:3-oxoacyl-(acyl-carrier-protein) synthase
MKRVVITGMGVVAPNGTGLPAFTDALRQGRSGIRFIEEMARLKLGCQVGAHPEANTRKLLDFYPENTVNNLRSSSLSFGMLAGIEAWEHAGLPVKPAETDWEAGCIFGTTICDLSYMRTAISTVDDGNARQLGSRFVDQQMGNNVSAYLSGLMALGNHTFANSSACSTGTESILLAYEKIKSGQAKRILTGSCEAYSVYMWSAFDAMRVLSRRFNDRPEAASRPLSQTAAGFVPGSGAAALVLEELETALARGATIYGEIAGGCLNSGGQRNGGSMTAPNPIGVTRCIQQALRSAHLQGDAVDLVCGHLTGTMADPLEIQSWTKALGREGADFPHINSVKSMIGHCMGGAGAIECVAAVQQMYYDFVHPNLNCEDLHESVAALVHRNKIPLQMIQKPVDVVIKANFGFGDVNAVVVFKKYS